MKKLITVSDLSYSEQFFSRMHSTFENSVIGIIGAFTAVFLLWLFFGHCEDAISGSGTVRPSENISSVHSLRSGKIEKIYFKDGQEIKQGDVLFSLYSDSEVAAKENLVTKIKILEEKYSDVQSMIESFKLGQNTVPHNRTVAFTRMKMFFEMKEQLAEVCVIYEKNFHTQQLLPTDVTTEELTLEAERLWRNAKINLSQFTENFLTTLISEEENYALQRDNLESSLAEIEAQLKNNRVVAPIDGTVLVLDSLNENDFIIANKPVLSIIPPSETGYEITVRVKEKDIADLQVGLQAKLKLPAFSNKVKNLNATVKKISADSLSNGHDIFYLVTLIPEMNETSDIDEKTIFKNSLSLKSGMIANAKIIVSEQKVISYLIKKMEIQL